MASIVVVEDDRDIAGLVAGYLRRSGHDVHVSYSGADGLAAIRSAKPNLAVVDWMMPDLDGIQVARAVRQLPALDGTVLLMVTARNSPDDVATARDAGFAAVLGKPFRRVEIQQTVEDLLSSTSPTRPGNAQQWLTAVLRAIRMRPLIA